MSHVLFWRVDQRCCSSSPERTETISRILITGGCGFVGSNLAHSHIQAGDSVVLYDNLSRPGAEKNLAWLGQQHEGRFELIRGDVRDAEAIQAAAKPGFDAIFHTAGQVAVTTSVTEPREDFEINALGTFNVLEAARLAPNDPAVVFTSTNKVYGGIEDAVVVERDGRYVYRDFPEGIDESQQLDFHSPYGCSKGAADQYVRDYARIYGVRSVVLRMSCQYGFRQFGTEDQGWVAHFVIAAHFGRDIQVFGDGKQIRDVLFIDDLVRAFRLATERIDEVKGQVFNIGGGPDNIMSLLDLIAQLEQLVGRKIPLHFHDWRPGDQRVFVSNIAKAKQALGWQPQISKDAGVKRLYDWVREHEGLFDS